nr:retrovirus-related Pol polyprotein from transposon TNT 1-94 [Tanacetum cinerariifolium]
MRRKERVITNALDAMIQIISLAIVQNHLATKIKRPSLEVLRAIAKMTPRTKLMMKLVSWLNRQMSPPPTKLSPLVDNDVGEEEAIENNTKVVNNSNKEDESIEVDEVVNIKEFKNHPLEKVIGNIFNQSKYIKEMLKKFELEDSKPTKTPMSPEIKLTKDDEADPVDNTKYRDAKQLLEAVKKRFGRNAATKKTQINLLKQQFKKFPASSSDMLDETFDRLQKLKKYALDLLTHAHMDEWKVVMIQGSGLDARDAPDSLKGSPPHYK